MGAVRATEDGFRAMERVLLEQINSYIDDPVTVAQAIDQIEGTIRESNPTVAGGGYVTQDSDGTTYVIDQLNQPQYVEMLRRALQALRNSPALMHEEVQPRGRGRGRGGGKGGGRFPRRPGLDLD